MKSMDSKRPIIVAVSSGKGGVGKTNFVANLALYYAGMNKKVLIMDADLGLSNIDVILGITPRYNLKHVLNGSKTLKEIVAEGPMGIQIIPASSGVRELTRLTDTQRLKLLSEIEHFDVPADVILIDTGAGISDNVLFFCSSAQETIVVVTPEPTSIADAYALIKVLSRDFGEKQFSILINMAFSEKESYDTFSKINHVAEKFLETSLGYLGWLPFDLNFRSAIKAQTGFISLYPNSNFTRQLAWVGDKILNMNEHHGRWDMNISSRLSSTTTEQKEKRITGTSDAEYVGRKKRIMHVRWVRRNPSPKLPLVGQAQVATFLPWRYYVVSTVQIDQSDSMSKITHSLRTGQMGTPLKDLPAGPDVFITQVFKCNKDLMVKSFDPLFEREYSELSEASKGHDEVVDLLALGELL